MKEMIVLAFEDEESAFELRDDLKKLQKKDHFTLEDAAVVVRRADGQVKVNQLEHLAGVGALGGGFWGLLVGALFLAPWLGLAIGAAAGAIYGSKKDVGLDDGFIKEVGETIQPGQSALFLLISGDRPKDARADLEKYNAKIIQTSLSEEEEAKLMSAFGSK